MIVLFGKNREDWIQSMQEVSAETALEGAESTELKNPGMLQILQSGAKEEKLNLLLTLHKQLHHASAEQLAKILKRAGCPLNVLPLIKEAIKPCSVCLPWDRVKAKPVLKLPQSFRFNEVVWIDLVYFSNIIIQVAVDEATRFTTLSIVDYKDEHTLATAFRRAWVSLFGPPKTLKSDSESSYASDSFANCLAAYGTERILRIAGDSHSWFGILDRRVQILRHSFPKLVAELSQDYLIVEPEDAIAELQHCCNTQLFYNGFSPYEVVFGCNPSPLLSDESEFVMEIPLFYEHQLVR
jgi:hypothetical protein